MFIEVTKDEVIIKELSDRPHEGEYKITTCYFDFDEFTNSFAKKMAVFTIISTDESYVVDIIDDECDIPVEILKHELETIKLGVYGYNVETNDDGEEILKNRFSPSYVTFVVPSGSYVEGAMSPEIVTPSQYELYSERLQEGLDKADSKIEELDESLKKIGDETKYAKEQGDYAKEQGNYAKGVADDTQEKADTGQFDGKSLEFIWQGTSLGIKLEGDEDYKFVNLEGIPGPVGPMGSPFQIKETYPTIEDMIADYDNMEINDYVMIDGDIEEKDNATLWVKEEQEDPIYRWHYLADFSGASGVVGPTGASVRSAMINDNGELVLTVE